MVERKTDWKRLTGQAAALVLAVGLIGGCVRNAPTDAPAPRAATTKVVLTEQQRAKNVESFDVVWQTVRDQHYDPKTNGVDWNAVRDELRPKVIEATTLDDARAIMQDAIGRLGQSHFGIIPSDVYGAIQSISLDDTDSARAEAPRRGGGTSGISTVLIDGQVVVRSVDAGSSADAAGVRTGWVVKSVDGREIAPVIAQLRESLADESMLDEALKQAARALTSRKPGAKADFVFLNAGDEPVNATLQFTERDDRMVTFSNLPPMPLKLESRTLASNVGYISLSLWMDPAYVRPKVQQAIESFKETRGIIIDLRGNPGGIGAMAMGIGNFFVTDSQHKLGTMITRENKLNFVLFPQPTAYTGPLAILVDEGSASTSEIFAGGMKDIGRARIFGTPTPGLALPSAVTTLPNGDRFQYVFANYISAGGKPLEGDGVVPDETVELTRAALLAGRDPVIEKAVAWIETQSPPSTQPSVRSVD